MIAEWLHVGNATSTVTFNLTEVHPRMVELIFGICGSCRADLPDCECHERGYN